MKIKLMVLMVVVGMAMAGCGAKEDIDEPSDVVSNAIGVATDDSKLMVLVSYVDTTSYSPNRFERLTLITRAQFSSSTGYRFLGRAYSKDHPGLNGFSMGLFEYFVQIGDSIVSTYGFQYTLGTPCQRGSTCPQTAVIGTTSNPIAMDAVAYVAPPQVNLSEGIVPLYMYATPGGYMSAGSGNISFTVDHRDIELLQASGISVIERVIGAVFHATQQDCDENLSNFCN